MRLKPAVLLWGGEALLASALGIGLFDAIEPQTPRPNIAALIGAGVLSIAGGLCFVAGAFLKRRKQEQSQPGSSPESRRSAARREDSEVTREKSPAVREAAQGGWIARA